MAGKTAVKKASGPQPSVKPTGKTCFSCGVVLMSNAIFVYQEIVFDGASSSSRFRYTCKAHGKR